MLEVLYMDSTSGGFLVGFGLYLLMTYIVLSVVVKDVYYKLEMYRDH
jgi:hypothetical protein